MSEPRPLTQWQHQERLKRLDLRSIGKSQDLWTLEKYEKNIYTPYLSVSTIDA